MSKANKILLIQLAIGLLISLINIAILMMAPEHLHNYLTGGMLLLFSVYSLYVMFKWWQNLDEASRESHKWAMHWGGGIASFIGLVGMSLNLISNGALAEGIINFSNMQQRQFALGMILSAFLMAFGYGLAWAFWWLKRR